jgi:YhcH/YjgK/YiaL family protein
LVIDNIRNAGLYYGLGRGIEAALRFLENTDLERAAIGRQDIRGDDCYALIQEYETKPCEDGVWEAHRKYTDVQFIVSGEELMGYANLDTMSGMKITAEYEEPKDVLKFEGEGDFLRCGAGTFVIFTPHDAHMPTIAVADPLRVRKVVVKVLAED